MLYFLRSTGICVGLVAASLAIAPQLKAQPASIPIQVAYSKLDVNAVNLYYSDPVEAVESSVEEAVDLDSPTEEATLDDSSEESTSLQ